MKAVILPLLLSALLAGCVSQERVKEFREYEATQARARALVSECKKDPAIREALKDDALRDGACNGKYSMSGEYAKRCLTYSVDLLARNRIALVDHDTLTIVAACAARARWARLPGTEKAFHDLPPEEKAEWPMWDWTQRNKYEFAFK